MRPVFQVSVLLLVLGDVADSQTSSVFRARAVEQISADPFGNTSGSEADTEVEPTIAVDPSKPDILVAVFQQGRFDTEGGCVDPGFATSHDGGLTWAAGSLPALTAATGGPFERASDPSVAVGPDGRVYAATITFNLRDCGSAIAVQRSDDHGLSFTPPVLVQDDSSCSIFNDKDWIAVDSFPGSPRYGRVYAVWDRIDATGQPISLRYSDDHGVTWSALVNVSSPFFAGGLGVIPLVHPNGDLTLVYSPIGTPMAEEVAQISHDGGLTFAPPVVIGGSDGSDPTGMRTGGVLPGAAIDPVTGRLYAVWQDRRFRSDGLNDIVLSTSSDGGATWTSLRVVNEAAPNLARNRFTPGVAAYDGVAVVVYGIRVHEGARVGMRYITSTDGGITFSRERRVGRPGDLDFAATAGGSRFLGDYIGVTLSGSVAHAVWCRPSRPRVDSGVVAHQVTMTATLAR